MLAGNKILFLPHTHFSITFFFNKKYGSKHVKIIVPTSVFTHNMVLVNNTEY